MLISQTELFGFSDKTFVVSNFEKKVKEGVNLSYQDSGSVRTRDLVSHGPFSMGCGSSTGGTRIR